MYANNINNLFVGARQGAGTERGGDETSVRWVIVRETAVSSCAQEGQSICTPTSMWLHLSTHSIV
jgi:hypothetical protein